MGHAYISIDDMLALRSLFSLFLCCFGMHIRIEERKPGRIKAVGM
jgi:hypothetical protein